MCPGVPTCGVGGFRVGATVCMFACLQAGPWLCSMRAGRSFIRLYRSGDRPHPRHAADHGQRFLSSHPPSPYGRGGREGYMGVFRRGSSLGVGVGVSWLPSRAEVSSVARNGLRLTRRELEVSGCSFCPACLSPKKSLEGWNLLCERSEHRHNTLGVFEHHIPLSQTKINHQGG